MTPNEFMPQLKAYLEKKGLAFFANEEVKSIDIKEDKVLFVSTNKRTLKEDEFVIAAGSWSQNFAKKLNIDIPIQARKGIVSI
jgi:D-amino-acid dehydrogenase